MSPGKSVAHEFMCESAQLVPRQRSGRARQNYENNLLQPFPLCPPYNKKASTGLR